MKDDTPSDTRRRFVWIVGGSILAAAILGAILGYVLSAAAGLEQVTILAITFTISATSVAAYAAVGVATFSLTLALVFVAIERLE